MTKVVVTGANGFVGTHTIEKLLELNYEVVGVDLNIENLQSIKHPLLRTVKMDICTDPIENALKKGDKVLHLAAIARFGIAEANPVEAIRVNVLGTLRTLVACKKKQVDRIVFSSTGSVYGNHVKSPIHEDSPTRPSSIYGYSKLFAEQLIQYYSVPYVILRYGYIYGPRKQHGAISNFVRSLLQGRKPTIYGGNQLNDFVSIHDIVQANVLALETPYLNQIYNIGTGQALSIKMVYEYCRRATGKNIEPEIVASRKFDPTIFVYDISKAKVLLGYTPNTDIFSGIKEVVDWLNK